MIRRIIAAICTLMLVTAGLTAMASEMTEPSITVGSINVSGDFVRITGSIANYYDAQISYLIKDKATGSVIALGQSEADDEDEFSIECEISKTAKSGTYSVMLSTVKMDIPFTRDIEFMSFGDRTTVLRTVSTGTVEEISATFENDEDLEKYTASGCKIANIKTWTDAQKTELAKILESGFGGEFEVQSEDDPDYPGLYSEADFKKLVNVSIGYIAFTKTSARADVTARIYAEDFGFDIANLVAGKYLNTAMRAIEVSDGTELIKEKYIEAVAMTNVNETVDYKNMYEIVERFNGIFNLDLGAYDDLAASKKAKVMKALTSKDFDSVDKLRAAYRNAIADANKKDEGRAGSGNSGSISAAPSINTGESTTTAMTRFVDLDSVPWAQTAIYALTDAGIVSGTTAETFEPSRNITRAEFAKLLVCALKLANGNAECSFGDVLKSDWYYLYVASANEKGIASGTGDGMFGANLPITRQDMAVMINNAAESAGLKLEERRELTMFKDSTAISDYAKSSVETLYKGEVINGNGDGSFAPRSNATRAEAAQLIYRIWSLEAAR